MSGGFIECANVAGPQDAGRRVKEAGEAGGV